MEDGGAHTVTHMVRYEAPEGAIGEGQPLRKAAQVTFSNHSNLVTEFYPRSDAADAPTEGSVPAVSRQQFKDFLLAERNRVRYCGTLPLTICMWIVFLLVTWFHGNIQQVHRLRRCVHQTIKEIRVPHTLPDGTVDALVSLDTVSSVMGVWNWLSNGLVPALTGAAQHPGYVCTFNQVVGMVQLRQERQSVGSCKVEGALAEYYRGECRSNSESSAAFGPGAADRAFVAGGDLQGLSKANQRRFFAWLDVIRGQGKLRAEQLAASGWCDDITSVLRVQFALFNAEVQSFTLVTITFDFERGGLLSKDLKVSPLSINIYPTAWHVLVDIVWVFLISLLFFLALQEAADRKGRGFLGRCCGSFWMVLDWLSIVSGLGIVGFFVFFLQELGSLEQQVGSLGSELPDAAAETGYQGALTNILEELDVLILFKVYNRLGMFWYAMVILLRFFRGFMGQPRMAVIGQTIEAAANDLVHLGLILVVISENFVLGGCVLFGVELDAWASVSQAHRSTLAVLFGQGDLASMFDVAPLRATFWLVMFFVSVVFLVGSMVVAILSDHYSVAKLAPGQVSQSLLTQAHLTAVEWIWRGSYHGRSIYRFLYGRFGSSVGGAMPRIRNEVTRISTIPYDELLEAVTEGMDEAAESQMKTTQAGPVDHDKPYPWKPVDMGFLTARGIDHPTAEHLLWKCAACTTGHSPDDLPPDRLSFEFQHSMHGSYEQLNLIGDELYAWLSKRDVDFENLESRQRKLLTLSKATEPLHPALDGIQEQQATNSLGRPLEMEELMQVGDRLMELGSQTDAEEAVDSRAIVPLGSG